MIPLVAFYTFDPTFENIDDFANDNDTNIIMLKMSIYSLKRELKDYVEIRVYTTKINIMSLILKDYPCKIYKLPNKFLTGTNTLDVTEYTKRFKNIGHARVFLLYDIIWNEKRNTLYLDNDTGIAKEYGYILKNKLENLKEPLAWVIEQHQSIEQWCFNSGAGEPYDWSLLSKSSYIINNGIVFVPSNHIGRKCTRLMKNFYIELHRYYKKWNYGFDMTALSIVWNALNLGVFLDDLNSKAYGIIHYYGQKYNPGYKNQYSENILKWKTFLLDIES